MSEDEGRGNREVGVSPLSRFVVRMVLISIINVCQLSDSEDSIESRIEDIMMNADDGELQESVSKDLFVENAMKLEIIQLSLQRDKNKI